jgi:hypothetical protein
MTQNKSRAAARPRIFAAQQVVMVVSLAASSVWAAATLEAQDAPRTRQVPAGVNSSPLPLKHEPKPTSGAITSQDLMTRLYIVADDSLGGRDVGTEGHYKATEYLAAEAKRMGLQPAGENGTFFQELKIGVRRVDPMATFVAGGSSLKLASEWTIASRVDLSFDNLPVVFGGDLGDVRIDSAQAAGKLVALRVPRNNQAVSQVVFGPVLTPKGASGVILMLPDGAKGVLSYMGRPELKSLDPLPGSSYLVVSDSAATKLFPTSIASLQVGAEGARVTVSAPLQITAPRFPVRNVVALLEGSDPVLKHQYVAVGAHSDHVGTVPRGVDHDSILVFNRIVRPGGAEDEGNFGTPEQFAEINAELAELRKTKPMRRDSIFNGADDDGSGTVAVQEVAEYLSSLSTKPKRSTLFVWHAGEEKGLWGSAYYTEHPTVPRDSIVAQLNVDMVGRGSASDVTGATASGEPLRGGPDYLQLVGSRRLSTELGDLVERVNKDKKHNFVFDYAMDANGHPMNIYCRSDHYEYAKWGIPVTFFTTGGHSAYHQLTDEPQYIDYPHMQRVTRLIADIALELGNGARPKVDGVRMDPRGSCKQ